LGRIRRLIFKVMCRHCGGKQLVEPRAKLQRWSGKPDISKKRKVCVYCGKSFKVKDGMINEVEK